MTAIRVRVIDIETTGLPKEGEPNDHAIVEAARCDVVFSPSGEVLVGSPVSMLVDPGRPIDAEASATHHIVAADLVGAPGPAEAIAFLAADPPDFYAAHNADFDRRFFDVPEAPWICTYKAALRVWPDAPRHGNQVLRYWLGLDEGLDRDTAMPPHRAGPDTYVTAHLLAALVAQGTSLDDMARWSTGPALLPRIAFGKHKGSRWEDLPSDYLDWLANKATEIDRDAKANARHHLRKRGLA